MFGFPANCFQSSKNLSLVNKYHRKILPHSNFVILEGKHFAKLREFINNRPYHGFDAILTSRQTRLEITVFVWKSDVK